MTASLIGFNATELHMRSSFSTCSLEGDGQTWMAATCVARLSHMSPQCHHSTLMVNSHKRLWMCTNRMSENETESFDNDDESLSLLVLLTLSILSVRRQRLTTEYSSHRHTHYIRMVSSRNAIFLLLAHTKLLIAPIVTIELRRSHVHRSASNADGEMNYSLHDRRVIPIWIVNRRARHIVHRIRLESSVDFIRNRIH